MLLLLPKEVHCNLPWHYLNVPLNQSADKCMHMYICISKLFSYQYAGRAGKLHRYQTSARQYFQYWMEITCLYKATHFPNYSHSHCKRKLLIVYSRNQRHKGFIVCSVPSSIINSFLSLKKLSILLWLSFPNCEIISGGNCEALHIKNRTKRPLTIS